MDRKKPARAQRFNASHVVEAELEHLDWATRQPALRMLDAVYWRRRVLAVKCGFELTEFSRTDELASIGEHATRNVIPQIKTLLNRLDCELFPMSAEVARA